MPRSLVNDDLPLIHDPAAWRDALGSDEDEIIELG